MLLKNSLESFGLHHAIFAKFPLNGIAPGCGKVGRLHAFCVILKHFTTYNNCVMIRAEHYQKVREKHMHQFDKQNISKSIQSNITRLMFLRDWNNTDLATAAGVSQMVVSATLTIEGRIPSIEQLIKMAHALGVTMSHLTGEIVIDYNEDSANDRKFYRLRELDDSDYALVMSFAHRLLSK